MGIFTKKSNTKAADKLRGSLSANQYKDVILGLVFLKYVSDAYDERREAIRAELVADGMDDDQIVELIDDPEEYQGYGVFVVPPIARWTYLAENAKGKPASDDQPAKNIGELIDEATWTHNHTKWLPTQADRDYVNSCMVKVTTPGKFANYIAPPQQGVNDKPVEFEYVKFH